MSVTCVVSKPSTRPGWIHFLVQWQSLICIPSTRICPVQSVSVSTRVPPVLVADCISGGHITVAMAICPTAQWACRGHGLSTWHSLPQCPGKFSNMQECMSKWPFMLHSPDDCLIELFYLATCKNLKTVLQVMNSFLYIQNWQSLRINSKILLVLGDSKSCIL